MTKQLIVRTFISMDVSNVMNHLNALKSCNFRIITLSCNSSNYERIFESDDSQTFFTKTSSIPFLRRKIMGHCENVVVQIDDTLEDGLHFHTEIESDEVKLPEGFEIVVEK